MELLIGGKLGFPGGGAVPGRPQPYLLPPQKATPPPFRPQSSSSKALTLEGCSTLQKVRLLKVHLHQ